MNLDFDAGPQRGKVANFIEFCNNAIKIMLMQRMHHFSSETWHELYLPPAADPLAFLPDVKWGNAAQVFSPAFWRYQHWIQIELEAQDRPECRLGDGSLVEEVVACVLGGHGLPAETSLAYFHAMKSSGFFCDLPKQIEDVFQVLRTPVRVGKSLRRYRFWRTKGQVVFSILSQHHQELREMELAPPDVQELRSRLIRLPGIGLKTASWICRNWLASPDVAVIDVHILRSLEKLKRPLPRSGNSGYFDAERQFLALARSLAIPPQSLDLVMWAMIRQFPKIGLVAAN